MVCGRCVLVIENVLQTLKLDFSSVIMGEIELKSETLDDEKIQQIKQAIEPLGFELIGNQKQAQIALTKTALIQLIHGDKDLESIKLSEFISAELKLDYQSLSQLFSSVEGITVEKYFIQLKIERVKELLVYDELNLTQISYRLGYSSLAHLSSQFKQITGMSPSAFKKIKNNRQRQALDKI